MFALEFGRATDADAAELAALHTGAARSLVERFGLGAWKSETSEKQALREIRIPRNVSYLLIAREGGRIVGTLRLATKKPWAIDVSYFTPCEKALYLVSMAVAVDRQRQGIGSLCLSEARRLAIEWPAQAIRLDAFDAAAGAGGFYAKSGFQEKGRVIYRNAPLIYYERIL